MIKIKTIKKRCLNKVHCKQDKVSLRNNTVNEIKFDQAEVKAREVLENTSLLKKQGDTKS